MFRFEKVMGNYVFQKVVENYVFTAHPCPSPPPPKKVRAKCENMSPNAGARPFVVHTFSDYA